MRISKYALTVKEFPLLKSIVVPSNKEKVILLFELRKYVCSRLISSNSPTISFEFFPSKYTSPSITSIMPTGFANIDFVKLIIKKYDKRIIL